MHCGCWCLCPRASLLIHVVNALHTLLRAFYLADKHLLTLVLVHVCPIDGAQCHSTEPEVCPLLDKCRLGCSGMCRSVSTCKKPAGRAGAFTIFMMPFTRMERGSSEAFWVTGNETGFREICTADTPATEILLSHVCTRKYTALLAHLQTQQPPF